MKSILFIGVIMCAAFGASASQPSFLQGTTYWKTDGYGYVLEVRDRNVKFYDVTEHHCLVNRLKSDVYSSDNLTVIDQTQAQFEWDTLHPVKLVRLEELPMRCKTPMKSSLDENYQFNAPDTFDVFWFTFSEHYAFSDIKDWSWQENYNVWRAKINDETTERELLTVLYELQTNMDDGHAFIESQSGGRLAYYNTRDAAFNRRIVKAFEAQDKFTFVRDYYSYALEQQQANTASYFVESFQTKRWKENVVLAKLPDNLNYLSIEDMLGFSEDDSINNELMEVDNVMRQVLPYLNQSKGVVIDLRWNGGGYDVISERIMSYFIDEELQAGSKSYKRSQGFSQPQKIIIEPSEQSNYLGPIVVLTSQVTASAAESFTLYLQARGNVTFIGEKSNGSYSDTLDKSLPNGWSFTLSNERYFDLEGNQYEFTGFPVTKKFEYFDSEDLRRGNDPALEEAMSILK